VTTAWYIIPSPRICVRWFNVLHWPYTLWHLSYVAIGAGLAPVLSWPLLGWTLLAFFLGMGIAAHCYDLLKGDPLRLSLPKTHLFLVGYAALLAAMAIGVWQVTGGNVPIWLVIAIPVGFVLAMGYGLEWPILHGDWQFAAWWAVFPFLVGHFAQGLAFNPAIMPMGMFLFLTALVQRVLSTRARYLRRNVEGDLAIMTSFSDCLMVDGQAAGKSWVLKPLDRALTWLSGAMVLLALATLSSHL
jgi:hypothetical protein